MGVVVKIMGPFVGTLNINSRVIIGTQKGTIILTTTHLSFHGLGPLLGASTCGFWCIGLYIIWGAPIYGNYHARITIPGDPGGR